MKQPPKPKVTVKATKVIIKPTAKIKKPVVQPKIQINKLMADNTRVKKTEKDFTPAPKYDRLIVNAKKPNFKNSASTNVVTPQKKAIAYAKGKKIRDPFEQILDAPQKSAMYLMGKGYKKPSEAMGIKNKNLATATDVVLDPTNALFFLKGAKLGKAAKEAAKPKITKGINLTHPKDASRIASKAKKYKAAAASLDAQSVYNDLTKKTK
jgi:hypothetical protein